MQNVLMIILALCGLGFLILVHEFGHFIVAKIFGIKVEAFSIGFGPVLLKFKWGETEYRFSLLFPLGGYVKLYGETSKESGQIDKDDKRAMVNRPLWQKISVVFAGVFMNFVFGVLFCITTFLIGLNMSAPVVGDISPNSLESNSPMSIGDTIISVNDKKVRYLEEYLMLTIMEDRPLKIKVKDTNNNEKEFVILQNEGKSGVSRYLKAVVDDVLDNSPMSKWGFKKNDVILKVNNNSIKTWQEFMNHLAANYEKEVTVVVSRENISEKELKFNVKMPTVLYGFDSRKFMSNRICGVKKYSPAESAGINKNDLIISVNGKTITTWYDLNTILWEERMSSNLELQIMDFYGNKRIVKVKNVDFNHGKPFLGVTSCADDLNTNIFQTVPKPFLDIGINPQDKLLEVNGKKVTSINELLNITAQKEESVNLKIETKNKEIKEFKIKLEKLHLVTEGILGAVPKIDVVSIKYPFLEAVIEGHKQAVEFVRITYLSIVLLIKKQVSPKDIAGPVGIIALSAKVAQKGLIDFLYLLALISLNLAVLNLLPIPVLDGSLIFMFTMEKILGRQLPEIVVKTLEIVGLCLLIGLLLFAMRNDILRMIK